MPTFETPPDWWISLANLTDWFEWPAIAALLTFLVLLNTVRIADRNHRAERTKDSILLRGARSYLTDMFSIGEEVLENRGESSAVEALIIIKDQRIVESFHEIKLHEAPSVEALRLLSLARSQLLHTQYCIESLNDDAKTGTDLKRSLRELKKTNLKMELEARNHLPKTWSVNGFPAWARTKWSALQSARSRQ